MNWLKKYSITDLDNIIGLNENIGKCKKWIESFETNNVYKPILYINGSYAIGNIAKLLLKKYNYNFIELNSYNFRNKNIEQDITDILDSNTIYTMFTQQKKSILIDTMITDKNTITKIMNIIKKKKKKKIYLIDKPIILISDTQNDRKINEFQNISEFISINKLNTDDFLKYIKIIIENENLNIDNSNLIYIYKQLNYNIKDVIIYLEELYKLYKNKPISTEKIDELNNIVSSKNIKKNLFTNIHNILHKYYDIEYTLKIYNDDRSLVPMMIHENYINYINLKKCSKYQKLITINNVINYISNSDNLDYLIHNYQLWYLQKYNGISYSCQTSYEINKFQTYSGGNNYLVEFTHLLSKSALQYYNYQNNIYLKNIFSIDNNNIINIVIYILQYIFDNNIEYGISYIKLLNNDIDTIYKFVKLSKIFTGNDYKTKYTNSFKNKIMKRFPSLNK